MAHFTRLRATDSQWANGTTVSGSDMQVLDQKFFRAWNGDAGGTWTPAAGITIGGAGMWLCGPWLLQAGAFLTVAIALGDNDYVGLFAGHTSATRTFHCSMEDVYSPTGWSNDNVTGSAKVQTLGSDGIFPLRVHNGARIVSVTFTFSISDHTATGVPAQLPRFRVFALEAATGIILPLGTPGGVGGGVDVNGFLQFNPTPASAAAWFAAGAAQTFLYTLDSGVTADVGRYAYFAEVIDESGVNALVGNRYFDASVIVNTITDMRFA